jgi:hypothetical protein
MYENKQNESNNLSKDKGEQLQLILDGLDEIAGKRDKVVTVRLTEKEHAILKAKAKLSGNTITDFLVKAIDEVKVAGFADVRKQIEDIYK